MKSLILLAAALALVASGCAPAPDAAAGDTTNVKNSTENAGAPDASPAGEEAEGDSKMADASAASAPLANAGGKLAVFTNDKGELICPVMKSVIESANRAVGYQDHEGKRYYFCCDGCPEVFKKDPAKWAAN